MSPEASRQEMEAGALQLSVAPWATVTLWSGASPISASYALARCSQAIALLNRVLSSGVSPSLLVLIPEKNSRCPVFPRVLPGQGDTRIR
jgi:hypothetical protein